MKKIKYLVAVIIVIAGILIIWGGYALKASKSEIKKLEQENIEIKKKNNEEKRKIDSLEVHLDSANIVSADLNATIDSIQREIDRSRGQPCEHQLALYKDQNAALHKAVEKCEEAKGIQELQKKGLVDIIVRNEVVVANYEQMVAIERGNNKKNWWDGFWKGLLSGGGLMFLILLL